jgi:uncharacterized membrane protein
MQSNFLILDKAKRKEILILILCLLIGFALRFYTFDKKSLWIDEIHTYNDSKYGFEEQLKFYQERPFYLHPPLFFLLTHLFYPFTEPERDLRIFPLIFGILSIPMIYFLTRLFSPAIALPCSLSLAFMAYHISISQDGRAYALLMFLGMTGLYFFMKHLKTSKRKFLFPAAFFFAFLLHTSYSSIPFVALSQILWFYRLSEDAEKPRFSSFLIFNGLLLLFSLPWILFIALNYKSQPIMDPYQTKVPIYFEDIIYGILHDWVPHVPLMIISVILLILFPIFSRFRKNALVLLAIFILPAGGLYLYCKLFNVAHFITSRYFIGFLPLFFITLYLSLNTIEDKFQRLKKIMRLRFLFVILFIVSNLVILPLYYRSEKEDFKGLVKYLKAHLREGDKLFDVSMEYMPGILHYFGVYPESRHYAIPFWKGAGGEIEYRKSFTYQNKIFTIYHSKTCCNQYVADGSRLWIIAGTRTAKIIKGNSPFVLKGYFDGSFLNFNKFPTDASMYLFLWDPISPGEKGIDMPIG